MDNQTIALTGLFGRFAESVDAVGLGNVMGRMFLIICLMMVAGLAARDHKVMRVVLPLGMLGVGIVGGWVPLWIVVLLSIGVGLGILGFVAKRSGAGG